MGFGSLVKSFYQLDLETRFEVKNIYRIKINRE